MNDFQKFQRLVLQKKLDFVVEICEGVGVDYYVRDQHGFLGTDFEYTETYHGAINLSHNGQHWNAGTVGERVAEIERFYAIRSMDTFKALTDFLDLDRRFVPMEEWKEARRKALGGPRNE